MSTPLRLVMVEDHELSRFGLVTAMSGHDSLQVVGEADNGKDGIDIILKSKPDIVLMDIGLPDTDGITATKTIKEALPDTKVIMLTSMNHQEEVLAALTAGADAYCLKDIKLDRLYQVIEMVCDGAIWLDPSIARLAMHTLLDRPEDTKKEVLPSVSSPKRYNAELTEREYEVLQLIVDGKSNKEIAVALNVTAHTAKAHVANILQKFAVTDRTQVAVKALQEGLLNR